VAADGVTGDRPERAIGARGVLALLLTVAIALLPALALPDGPGGLAPLAEPDVAYAAVDAPCGGEPMPSPDAVVTGGFEADLQGSYVMVPFDVPAGTDAIRVKYCHDQPALAQIPGTSTLNKHTLDLGLYGPRAGDEGLWDEAEFRGWGGSSRKDVTLSPEASIDPDPAPVATTETTVGYRPGPIEPGAWAAELGVAAVGQETVAEDGEVRWRIEVDLIDDPAYADDPYEPVPYDEAPADASPGWYAGDFHVHARNSAPGDATMRETFDYAFADAPAGPELDFITLSDYVTDRSWGEIGAFQADYPGKLIVRSSEVITYRGHANNHGGGEFVDYRTGPILLADVAGAGTERQVIGLSKMRDPQAASRILQDILDGGGWTQLNHVETFPSEVPTFGNLCRGCSWEYSDAETGYPMADAIEVATGPAGLEQGPVDPGPNPFTPLALRFYEDALDANGANANRIAAVGSSDSHNAGTPDDPLTQSPIGTATTVVFAPELSEDGIGEGVREQHTYVKPWGPDGPDLRFEASAPSLSEPLIMGDTVPAAQATMTARVTGLDRARAARGGAYTLYVQRNGSPFLSVPLPPGDEFELEFPSIGGTARYSLLVERVTAGASVEAVSSPIWVDPAGDPEDSGGPEPPPPPDPPASCREAPPLRLTPADDSFTGSPEAERVRGGRGRDRLRGRGGADCLAGGRGADAIAGGGGRDALTGGAGPDRLRARDGRRDLVRCGRGEDTATVDRRDLVSGCERVRRGRR
jgi:hypothetical protein